MSSAEMVKALEAIYTEEEIAATLSLPLYAVRQRMANPNTKLSLGARSELLYESDTGQSLTALAQQYYTSVSQVKSAMSATQVVGTPSIEQISLTFRMGHTIEQIASSYRTTTRYVTAKLIKAGLILAPAEAIANRNRQIQSLLAQGFTHKEIAKAFDVSRETVTALNPNKRYHRAPTKLTEVQWSELLTRAKTEQITDLAREYKVSRQTIYNRKNIS